MRRDPAASCSPRCLWSPGWTRRRASAQRVGNLSTSPCPSRVRRGSVVCPSSREAIHVSFNITVSVACPSWLRRVSVVPGIFQHHRVRRVSVACPSWLRRVSVVPGSCTCVFQHHRVRRVSVVAPSCVRRPGKLCMCLSTAPCPSRVRRGSVVCPSSRPRRSVVEAIHMHVSFMNPMSSRRIAQMYGIRMRVTYFCKATREDDWNAEQETQAWCT